MNAALLALLLLAAAPSRADDEAQGPPPTEMQGDDQAKALRERLATSPAAQGALADRIARSRLAERITDKTDKMGMIADIQKWIRGNPDAATQMAIGLTEDDAAGSHHFEDNASRTVDSHLVHNAGSAGNLFNTLKKAGLDSKLMRQAANENMADEEKQELIKKMFEGKSAAGARVLTQEMGKGGGAGVLNAGYYDRLNAGNLHGYSPQLQALQSSLNARRAPGAPKLIETGKLDYETLSYPAYGMRYDIEGLRKRLNYERAWALAKLLGKLKDLSPAQLQDPSILAMLEKEAGARAARLSPRFLKRQHALDKAAAALSEFDNAALPSKDPLQITRGLLQSLGGKQREAARWITVAGLEEELQRLDAQEGFLSAELDAQIERCPVTAGDKTGYRRRGQEYLKKLKDLKAGDESAVAALETDGWLDKMDEIEKTLAQCVVLRKDLSERISDFVATPYRLSSLVVDKPRWRQFVDDWMVRLLPASAYAKRLKSLAAERDVLKDVFVKIALGDLDAAHTILGAGAADATPRR